MGYEEKFLYCDNNRDTKALLNMLKEKGSKGFKVLEILTLKRNWNARYRNIEGIGVNGKIVPFTFTSAIEMENPDQYYRKPSVDLTEYDIATIKNGNVSQALGEEHEHFFNKNDILIWICGNRGNIVDGYSLFGISDVPKEY